MDIRIADGTLVVLVGASGSGKSTFARSHFEATEIVSSDRCRAMVADDESALYANDDAFTLLHTLVTMRLRLGRTTVVDATNLEASARAILLQLARDHHRPVIAVVLDVPGSTCAEHNAARPGRTVPPEVVTRHVEALREAVARVPSEGFDDVVVLRTPEEAAAAVVKRSPSGVPSAN